jgi:hypothetical protein
VGYPKIKKSGMGQAKSMKDRIIKEPGMGYPKINYDKSKVAFFVLGYLSLSNPILLRDGSA